MITKVKLGMWTGIRMLAVTQTKVVWGVFINHLVEAKSRIMYHTLNRGIEVEMIGEIVTFFAGRHTASNLLN